jgi:putative ABC transport system permease protein
MVFVELLWRQWQQRPARNLLSLLSIAIAVAAVLGSRLAQSSVRITTGDLTRAIETLPAIDVVSSAGGRFSAAKVPDLSGIAGIREQVPIVARATSGRVKGKPFRMLLVGLPPNAETLWQSIPLTTGQAPRAAGEAVITDEVADSLKVEIGDRVLVLTRRGPRSATVTGTTPAASLQEIVPGGTLIVPLETVQQWFSLGDDVDRIRLVLENDGAQKAATDAVNKQLPDAFVTQHPLERTELINSVLRSTELALRFAGALSMALAAFIVLNTLRMNFSERRKQLATLRVIGSTAGQMTWLHLLEGVVLGIAGTIVGIPLGIGLGRALTIVMQRIVSNDVPDPIISWEPVLFVAILGPLVASGAALVPAFFARKVSPLEALGDQEVRASDRFPIWAIVSAAIFWLIALSLLVMVVRKDVPADIAIPAGLLMLVAFIALLPAILGPILRWLDWALTAVLGIEANLAAGQLLRRPTRTGLTVGLLVVVLSNGLGLGNAVINNVDDIRAWHRRSLSGDFLVSDPSSQDVAASNQTSMRDEILKIPGVSSVVGIRLLTARAAGMPSLCVVRDFPPEVDLPWSLSEDQATEVRAALKRGDAVVSSVIASKAGLKVGDPLRVEVQGSVHSCQIAAIVNDYTLGGMAVILDNDFAQTVFATGLPGMCVVRTSPDDRESVGAALKALATEKGLTIQSFAQIREQLDTLINGVVGALWVLLALGFVVGGFGIANTLTMSVLEQTRELGLLRIIGMTRQQIFKIVFCEALYLAIAACLLGTIAGMSTAYVIHLTNEPLMGRTIAFSLQWPLLLLNAALCVVVALGASLWPGRRVTRLNLLAALAYE